MKKKQFLILLIFSLFIFANIMVYKITAINQEQRIDSTLKSISNQLQIHYELQIYHQTITADAAYEATMANKEVITILKKVQTASPQEKDILRQKLYDLLIDDYKILKLQGILQYQFNLQDNTAFLRLHKPSKFDDDLTDVRYSYTYVNQEHKIIRGLEQGKTTHGFRNVYPLFDENNNYLCAVEISYSSDLIQKMLTDVSKIHTHFIVDKKVIDMRAWKTKKFVSNYTQSDENENFMMSQMKEHKTYEHFAHYQSMLTKYKDLIDTSIKEDKKFSFYDLYQNETDVISFYPIRNIKEKKTIAWLVAYSTNYFINETINNTFYIRVLFGVIFLSLSLFIYFILTQKEILKERVLRKTKELKDSNHTLEKRVAEELEKNKQAQQQLFKSEKLASMGEMIGNIAHQWRQPLSIISTAATGIILQKQYGKLKEAELLKNCTIIDENAQYLSKTIDDFRDFIKGDKRSTLFNLQDTINSFLHLIEPSVKNHNISIVVDNIKAIKIENHPNELIQCFINIYNNSRDILKTLHLEKNYIFISLEEDKDFVTIKFKDNAGGIKPKILPKIFEPYFTTKHKSQGTGLGLHMTYNLITNGMKGTIEAKNISYSYENKKYNGAEFIITLPKRLK